MCHPLFASQGSVEYTDGSGTREDSTKQNTAKAKQLARGLTYRQVSQPRPVVLMHTLCTSALYYRIHTV